MLSEVKAVMTLGPLCCVVSKVGGSPGAGVACGIFPMT